MELVSLLNNPITVAPPLLSSYKTVKMEYGLILRFLLFNGTSSLLVIFHLSVN